jgi:hypothetical protein
LQSTTINPSAAGGPPTATEWAFCFSYPSSPPPFSSLRLFDYVFLLALRQPPMLCVFIVHSRIVRASLLKIPFSLVLSSTSCSSIWRLRVGLVIFASLRVILFRLERICTVHTLCTYVIHYYWLYQLM